MSEDVQTPPVNDPPSDAPIKAKSSPVVVLKGELRIFPDQNLPRLTQGEVKAYRAQGADGRRGVAVICEKNIVPQAEIIHKYMGVVSPFIPKLLACGLVDWTPTSDERFAFVYEDRLGEPIDKDKNPAAMGLKPDLVISTIFRNLLEVIRALHENGIAHGNIRVQNLFDGGGVAYEGTMLGGMLSTPSGYAQPVICETIPRAMASPLGRGAADFSDDIYALGITLSALIRHFDPAEGLSDEEIIEQKIDQGSFNFITGKDRFPGPILEFLRGTLNDDARLRWTFDDILVWADGRRVSPKQTGAPAPLRASRPLEYNRQKFLKPQSLLISIAKDPPMAVPMIENGDLYLWLNRSIQNKDIEKRYEEALDEAKNGVKGTNYAEKLVALVSMALFPESPVLYRGLRFLPSGFGNLMVDAMCNRKDLSIFVDIIQNEILGFWSRCNVHTAAGADDAINRIKNCQRMLGQAAIGYGLERCIYYLSPMAPCLSEKLSDYYVRSADDYLNALEKMSQTKKRPEWFFDRHIIAFLSVRDKSIIEPYMADVSATERHRQRLGALKVLSGIQQRDKMGPVPGVSMWVCELLDPLIDRFHDRQHRKKVREQIERYKDKGSLDKIAALFGNFDQMQMDMKSFSLAIQQFQGLRSEYNRLEHQLDNNPKFGMAAGRQAATLVSGVITGLVVAIYLIYIITSGGLRIF